MVRRWQIEDLNLLWIPELPNFATMVLWAALCLIKIASYFQALTLAFFFLEAEILKLNEVINTER